MQGATRHNSHSAWWAELTLSAVPIRIPPTAGCGHPTPAGARSSAIYCSNACRQRAYRARVIHNRGPVIHNAGGELQGTLNGPVTPRRRRPVTVIGAGRLAPAEPPPDSAAAGPTRALPSTVVQLPHEHSSRLCATCTAVRFAQLQAAPRARVNPTAVAETMRKAGGNAWAAVTRHRISYGHALRIRRGWRGAGRVAEPIPYRSRGFTHHGRNGHSTRGVDRLVHRYRIAVIDGGAVTSRQATA